MNETGPTITQLPMGTVALDAAHYMASQLGYEQTAYTSSSAMWGLFCLPENPEHADGPHCGGCIVLTKEFGLVFLQDAEDLHMADEINERM